MRIHSDIFTPAEAATYLHLSSEESLRTLHKKYDLKVYKPFRGYTFYWREDLDSCVNVMFGIDPKKPKPVCSPSECGVVYFLFRSEVLVYVGQTIQSPPEARYNSHKRDKKFDSVKTCMIPLSQLDEVERGLIAYCKPEYNKTHRDLSPAPFVDLLTEHGFFD